MPQTPVQPPVLLALIPQILHLHQQEHLLLAPIPSDSINCSTQHQYLLLLP
jgi:hypothetical protein